MQELNSLRKAMPDWQFVILFLLLVFVHEMLMAIQGLDMVDEGYNLCACQQLFEHPDSAENQFCYYNGIFLGAVWNFFFSSWGILGFRLLNIILTLLTVYVVYITLKDYVNKWCILAGVLLIVINKGYVIARFHNSLSALLCCLAVFFLLKALVTDNNKFGIVAGTIIGINIFSRLPNVTMLALCLVLIPYYLYNKSLTKTLHMLLAGFIGVIIGIGLEFLIMWPLGHTDYILNGVFRLSETASEKDSTHSLIELFSVYAKNYKDILLHGINLLSVPAITFILLNILPQKRIVKTIVVASLALIYFKIIFGYNEGSLKLYALCYIVLGLYASLHYREQKKMFLIAMAIIIMTFLPFGSDQPVNDIGRKSMWIALPLALGFFEKMVHSVSNYQNMKYVSMIFSITFASAFLLRLTIDHINYGTFDDAGSRLRKTYFSTIPQINVFSEEHRVHQVEEAYTHLKEFVKEKDYLLCWQCVPMFHYLTHTYPYLNNSWPWTYNNSRMEMHFQLAENNIDVLPVVLCNKSMIPHWFEYNANWNNPEFSGGGYNGVKVKFFEDFVIRHNYETVWENELFRIMLPYSSQKY